MKNILIKKWETFRSDPYLCPAGKATIGYGLTMYPDGTKVTMQDWPISEKEACNLLDDYIAKHVTPVINKYVYPPINVNKKDALKSLIFNIGSRGFRASTLLKKLNKDDFDGAADEFLRWDKATVKGKKRKLRGLTLRRWDERELFLTPTYHREKEPLKKLSKWGRVKRFFRKVF